MADLYDFLVDMRTLYARNGRMSRIAAYCAFAMRRRTHRNAMTIAALRKAILGQILSRHQPCFAILGVR
jgi:hypothetical protein